MKKWAAPGTLIDSISTAGFATVMNVQQVLSTISGTPTTASILAAFKSGTHPNFLSHPYTCDGQAMKGAPAICNDYYLMNQIQNGGRHPAGLDRLGDLEGLLPWPDRLMTATGAMGSARRRAGGTRAGVHQRDLNETPCPATSSS